VLTDLTSRSEVNINLLTHLEYDRAAKLVNEGYSVYAAKKQADYEIMTAFGFATSVEYSEDLKTFVPSTSEGSGRNATLMAISLLFIGDRSEAEIQNAINSFKSDLAEDGEWDNGQMKADMADWAEAFDGGSVRANVKSWNILDIPDYENYLTITTTASEYTQHLQDTFAPSESDLSTAYDASPEDFDFVFYTYSTTKAEAEKTESTENT
jgi:hypothetical protein